MKLLWYGDNAESGFGRVTREIGKRLLALGHDVRFANTNVHGWPQAGPLADRTWNRDYFAPQEVAEFPITGIAGWKPEETIVLADLASARDLIGPAAQKWKDINAWNHVPIEGRDLPPLWRGVWDLAKPIAITEFGATQIAKVIGTRPPVVYHGVDTDVFHRATPDRPLAGFDASQGRPFRIRNKAEAKAHFGLDPNDTILLRTDRHMPRKNYNLLIRDLAPVLDERDDLKLVIHCRTIDHGGNLLETKGKFSERIQSKIGLTNAHDTWRGMGETVLAALYNAADLYVSNCSEGFGLALLESMACGTPVIGLDYAATPEVLGDSGFLVPAVEIDNVYDHYWGVPVPGTYGDGVRHALANLDGQAERCEARAAELTWDRAAEGFHALLTGQTTGSEPWSEPASTVAA